MKTLSLIKMTKKVLGATVLMLALQGTANAQEGAFFGSKAPGKWVIGGKVGKVDPNVNNLKNADAIGIVLGYEFERAVGAGTSSFELEYLSADETNDFLTTTGNRDFFLDDLPPNATRYDAEVLSAFFTYRSPGKLYYKVKAGLSYGTVDISGPGFTGFDREDVSIAGGIGLGYRVSDIGVVEVEYSADTGESDLAVVGVNALLQF